MAHYIYMVVYAINTTILSTLNLTIPINISFINNKYILKVFRVEVLFAHFASASGFTEMNR